LPRHKQSAVRTSVDQCTKRRRADDFRASFRVGIGPGSVTAWSASAQPKVSLASTVAGDSCVIR